MAPRTKVLYELVQLRVPVLVPDQVFEILLSVDKRTFVGLLKQGPVPPLFPIVSQCVGLKQFPECLTAFFFCGVVLDPDRQVKVIPVQAVGQQIRHGADILFDFTQEEPVVLGCAKQQFIAYCAVINMIVPARLQLRRVM